MDQPSVWVVGSVFTGRRLVGSVLVENGRVVALGEASQTARERATGTEKLEVRHGLVLPGLVDPHVHPVHVALRDRGVDLTGVGSAAELVRRVEAWSQEHPDGPVIGRGWDQERFPDHAFPTADALDRLSEDRPVILFRVCSHVAVLNRAALEAVGIDERTPETVRGRVGRDRSGSLNGLLFEDALRSTVEFVDAAVLAWPGAVASVLEEALTLGLTTLAPLNSSLREIEWGLAEEAAGRMPLRLRHYARARDLEQLGGFAKGMSRDRVRVTGVKFLLDGSFGARTAWLRDPYTDRPDDRGAGVWTDDEFSGRLQETSDAGWRPAVHAIGDAAVDQFLRVAEANPSIRPLRLEHAALASPDLLKRMARVGPDLVVQPGFVRRDTWIVERLGAGRAEWSYPFRAYIDSSLRLAGSSDAPVESLDPFEGMRSAVHRAAFRAPIDRRRRRAALTSSEAVHLYTIAGGEVLGEPVLGTLEVGGMADWTVVDGSSLASAIDSPSPNVRETWVDGRQAYRRA